MKPGASIGPLTCDNAGTLFAGDYRREFTVGPADESAIDPAAWRIEAPASATREPVRVVFPEPLDHGMLRSAMGLSQGGRTIEGEISTEDEERRWLFTPRGPGGKQDGARVRGARRQASSSAGGIGDGRVRREVDSRAGGTGLTARRC